MVIKEEFCKSVNTKDPKEIAESLKEMAGCLAFAAQHLTIDEQSQQKLLDGFMMQVQETIKLNSITKTAQFEA